MIRRVIAVALVALTLSAVAGVARVQLDRARGERIPAALLYLPKGPFLRALALGHEEVLADLLYIWSIQYYSNYSDKARYEYLEAVFDGAITELDPRFTEVYLVGAMIMAVEARRPDLALRLYDKGLEKMPGNWELGYWAGWEAYTAKKVDAARGYWLRAAAMPGAPASLARLAARTLEKLGDRRSALAEYERMLASGADEKTKRIVQSWVDRLRNDEMLERTRSAVVDYRINRGRCPPSLDALVRSGLLREIPTGANGARPYYDPRTCEVLPAPRQSFGGGS